MACDYLRPLVAGQSIEVRVWITEIGRAGITFCVVGENEHGESCFRVRLLACLVEGRRHAAVPVPPGYREGILNYQAHCVEAPPEAPGGSRSVLLAGRAGGARRSGAGDRYRLAPGATEDMPLFTRERRVAFGDCGASGIIYAPKVYDYAVEAVGEWYEDVPGISWMELVCDRGQGAPFVSVNCEYLRPMVPGQTITLAVWVTRLGGASIEFAVIGFGSEGEACFDARMAACFIDQRGFRSIRIPEEYRQRIQAYQAACDSGVTP